MKRFSEIRVRASHLVTGWFIALIIVLFALGSELSAQLTILHRGCGSTQLGVAQLSGAGTVPEAGFDYEIKGFIHPNAHLFWVLGPKNTQIATGVQVFGCIVWNPAVIVPLFVHPWTGWVHENWMVPNNAKGMVYEQQIVAIELTSGYGPIETSAHSRMRVK